MLGSRGRGQGNTQVGAALVCGRPGIAVRRGRLGLRSAAGATGVPTQGRRRRLLPARQDGPRRAGAQRRRRGRPELIPLGTKRTSRVTGGARRRRRHPRSRGGIIDSGSRARRRPGNGVAAPSRSRSIANLAGGGRRLNGGTRARPRGRGRGDQVAVREEGEGEGDDEAAGDRRPEERVGEPGLHRAGHEQHERRCR